MNAKIFIDTNILIYAHSSVDPEKQVIAEEHLADCLRYGIGVVSAQVLNEFFVNVIKKIVPPMTPLQAKSEMRVISAMEVVEIDALLIFRAIDLVEKYCMNYCDALILASAEKAGCRTLLTEDFTHEQKFGHIEVRNPFVKKTAP